MKNTLITGASSGIGLALAWQLARRGHHVALLARRAEVLQDIVAQMTEQGFTAHAVACDVADASAVQRGVDEVLQKFGHIDVAVGNAGVGSSISMTQFKLDLVQNTMATNFFGVINLLHAVLPKMLERHAGQFVGVASLAGFRAMPGHGAYSASKAALQSFLESARVELQLHGVQVCTVNPGFVTTPMTAKNKFMPFLISAEAAARIMADGMENGHSEINFPLPSTTMMRVLRTLPNWAFDAFARRAATNL